MEVVPEKFNKVGRKRSMMMDDDNLGRRGRMMVRWVMMLMMMMMMMMGGWVVEGSLRESLVGEWYVEVVEVRLGTMWTERWVMIPKETEVVVGVVTRLDGRGEKVSVEGLRVEGEGRWEVVWKVGDGEEEEMRWMEVEVREGNEGKAKWAAKDDVGRGGFTWSFPTDGRFVLNTWDESGAVVMRRAAMVGAMEGVPVSPLRKYAPSVVVTVLFLIFKLFMKRDAMGGPRRDPATAARKAR